MSTIRKKYSKEEKSQIVRRSQEPDANIEHLAIQYQVHANSIYKWRREYLRQGDLAFPGNGNKAMSEEQRETAELKRRLRESELEVETLKKALGIFSSPNRKNLLQ
jgi:transposase